MLRVPKTSAAATSTQHSQLQELDEHIWACQLKSQGMLPAEARTLSQQHCCTSCLNMLFILPADPKEQRQAAFEDVVLRPLLGSQYIHRGKACLLPSDLVDALVKQLRQQGRPGDSSLSDRALLLPDHTTFCWSSSVEHAHAGCRQASLQPSAGESMLLGGRVPSQGLQSLSGSAQSQHEQHSWRAHAAKACICVEIKPKCGFLPTCGLIRHPVKRRMSRYQAHQQLKLAQGHIKQPSAAMTPWTSSPGMRSAWRRPWARC